MAGKSSVWVQVGVLRVRADRINEVSAAVAGRLQLQVSGHREPLWVELDPEADAEQTAAWGDRLLELIETRADRRADSGTLLVFQPAAPGLLAHWSARTLPGLRRLTEAPLDRRPVPETEDPQVREQRLANVAAEFRRASEHRLEQARKAL